MDFKSIQNAFQKLNIWSKNGKRAPHKPLLVLLALRNIKLYGKSKLLYKKIHNELRDLLLEFGPPSENIRPNYPFTKLANDKIKYNSPLWIFKSDREIDTTKDISQKVLIENNASGEFNEEIEKFLNDNPGKIDELIIEILNAHFPETLQKEIIEALGLELKGFITKRDPDFRKRILIAYEYGCAICGYNLRINNQLIGLEAAHIKWHMAGGPSIEKNGIALCSQHHILFDHGAFTLNEDLKIKNSIQTNGEGKYNLLSQFEGNYINFPQVENFYPDINYIKWHQKEVFKG